ncbi:MAG: SDR family NAD(P)-dependent oxidoreductase [Hyphomicrobiaceae bacterium]
MLLNGKVAIVTGGAHGIGRACVERFAAEGAKVVMADITDSDGNAAAKTLTEAGHAVRYVHANVAERLDVHNLIAAAVEAFGRVDIMVTSAGVMEAVPFLELEEADFDRTLRINLKGTFMCAQAAAKQMVRQLEKGEGPPGAIVAISSINAWFGLPNSAAYAASKGGVSQLTKSIAMALAEHGIRVNAVGPGTIETAMSAPLTKNDDIRAAMLARTPLGRLGKPEEMAAVAAWLASDQASYVTGQTIYADGGRMPLSLTTAQPQPKET